MRIAAVAWDLDGTLVDSEPLHQQALLAACRRWGVDLSDLPEDAFRGIHMPDVWGMIGARFPASLESAVWMEEIETHYVAQRHRLAPLAGAVETVRAIAALGLPQACVSNSSRRGSSRLRCRRSP